ncbi:MAG: MFS transporter [Pseudomonadota bacterium]
MTNAIAVRPSALIALLCLAELGTMLSVGAFAAQLPQFRADWGLSNAEAGWIDGALQMGYLLAVPVLVGLTDRIDARRVYLAAAALGALAAMGFALFAQGLWSACLFRILAGIGLAGSFMPGLKILSDRLCGAAQSRAVAFYTASFSLGMSLSVLSAGLIGARFGWPWAFAAAALGAALAFVIALVAVPHNPAPPIASRGWAPLPLRRLLRNRAAVGYSLAYAAHMWELFGYRAWLVAFFVFAASNGGDAGGLSASALAAGVLALSLPASVIGNEAALRFGRRRLLTAVMGGSALLAPLVGLTAFLPFWTSLALCALYILTVSADSASLTAGAVAAADPSLRGGAMAFHSLIGFAAAAAGPIAFGATLDLAGADHPLGWFAAFALLGIGVGMGPLILRRLVPAAG